MSESRNSLKDELQQEGEEYRYAYAEDFLNTSVATQIRVIREQRGLTQEELAQKIGTKQAGISRLENVNYSAWKTETLRKIARALKVRLKITFETFGTLLDEAEAFSRKNLERPSFEEDPAFRSTEIVFPPGQLNNSQNYDRPLPKLLTHKVEFNSSLSKGNETFANIPMEKIGKYRAEHRIDISSADNTVQYSYFLRPSSQSFEWMIKIPQYRGGKGSHDRAA